jgi:hypothetical protein
VDEKWKRSRAGGNDGGGSAHIAAARVHTQHTFANRGLRYVEIKMVFSLRSLYNVVKDPRGGGPRSQLGLPHKSSGFGLGNGPSSRVNVVSFELLYVSWSFLAYETEMLAHSPRYRYVIDRCRRPQYYPTNRHPQEANYESQSTAS